MDKTQEPITSIFASSGLDDSYKEALSKLGVFEKNLKDGTGFICSLWNEWGYKHNELQNGKWQDLIHPDDKAEVLSGLEDIYSGDASIFRQEYRVRLKDGKYRWILNQGVIVSRDSDGIPEVFVGTDIDIHDMKRTHEELVEAKAHAEERAQEAETLRVAGTIITSSLDLEKAVNLVLEQAMLVVPYETAAVFVTEQRHLELVGLRSTLPDVPRNGSIFSIETAEYHWKVLNTSSPVIEKNCIDSIPELGGIKDFMHFSWMGIPLRFRSKVVGIITFLSLDELNSKHIRLATSFADHVSVALNNARQHQGTLELATIDPLTKTFTRRWFFTQAESIFKQSIRNTQDFSILMVDIDNFKHVNDTYGHTVGDLILQRVCQACMLCLRASDVMGRYGGEEFSIILPETGAKEALLVAERLRRSVENVEHAEIEERISVSVGICTYAEQECLHEMVQAADTALYRAKESGRNRVCSFIPKKITQRKEP